MTENKIAGDQTSTENKKSKGKSDPAFKFPSITFSTFIVSLNSTALVHLGVMGNPATNESAKNLPVAKQTIDIIGMLEEKTKGNLTAEEEKLIKNILHDLRLMYVKEVK
ncbi:MAG: DUF1844 domain-containing protein [Proteobacteria bacterium]|nr:DUF1844 domain-containing protein [Pseudomonadota bacterium]